MDSLLDRTLRFEFEARIFVSLCIVLFVCVISFGILGGTETSLSFVLRGCGVKHPSTRLVGYLMAALILAIASLLRMWSGSLLSSQRVMSFQVRNDALMTSGPYSFVRNPIYFADFLAMCGFALCMPPS